MELLIRKIVTTVEQTHREGDRPIGKPHQKAAAMAVIKNPFAGNFVEDLSPLFEFGDKLGGLLAEHAVTALGAPEEAIQSYGKAAIVGSAGELEHCAAILHPKLGKPLRSAIGGGEAIIPSAKKRGAPGTAIDIPLHYKDDEWEFSNFDAMEVRVVDAPAPDEIVVAIAITDSGRPFARVGNTRIL